MPETIWIIVRVAIILGIGYLLTVIAMRGLYAAGTKAQIPTMLLQPLRNLLKLISVAIILTLIAGQFGVDLMTILTATVAMVAIGFIAVWSMVSNVTATLLLVTIRPFNIGDSVQFAGEETAGKVKGVNLFYTTLETESGDSYQIPNNMFFQKVIKRQKATVDKAIPIGDHLADAD
jgi:small-conductance mechanosensitive channel